VGRGEDLDGVTEFDPEDDEEKETKEGGCGGRKEEEEGEGEEEEGGEGCLKSKWLRGFGFPFDSPDGI